MEVENYNRISRRINKISAEYAEFLRAQALCDEFVIYFAAIANCLWICNEYMAINLFRYVDVRVLSVININVM